MHAVAAPCHNAPAVPCQGPVVPAWTTFVIAVPADQAQMGSCQWQPMPPQQAMTQVAALPLHDGQVVAAGPGGYDYVPQPACYEPTSGADYGDYHVTAGDACFQFNAPVAPSTASVTASSVDLRPDWHKMQPQPQSQSQAQPQPQFCPLSHSLPPAPEPVRGVFVHDSTGGLMAVRGDSNGSMNAASAPRWRLLERGRDGAEVEAGGMEGPKEQHELRTTGGKIYVHDSDGVLRHVAQCTRKDDKGRVQVDVIPKQIEESLPTAAPPQKSRQARAAVASSAMIAGSWSSSGDSTTTGELSSAHSSARSLASSVEGGWGASGGRSHGHGGEESAPSRSRRRSVSPGGPSHVPVVLQRRSRSSQRGGDVLESSAPHRPVIAEPRRVVLQRPATLAGGSLVAPPPGGWRPPSRASAPAEVQQDAEKGNKATIGRKVSKWKKGDVAAAATAPSAASSELPRFLVRQVLRQAYFAASTSSLEDDFARSMRTDTRRWRVPEGGEEACQSGGVAATSAESADSKTGAAVHHPPRIAQVLQAPRLKGRAERRQERRRPGGSEKLGASVAEKRVEATAPAPIANVVASSDNDRMSAGRSQAMLLVATAILAVAVAIAFIATVIPGSGAPKNTGVLPLPPIEVRPRPPAARLGRVVRMPLGSSKFAWPTSITPAQTRGDQSLGALVQRLDVEGARAVAALMAPREKVEKKSSQTSKKRSKASQTSIEERRASVMELLRGLQLAESMRRDEDDDYASFYGSRGKNKRKSSRYNSAEALEKLAAAYGYSAKDIAQIRARWNAMLKSSQYANRQWDADGEDFSDDLLREAAILENMQSQLQAGYGIDYYS